MKNRINELINQYSENADKLKDFVQLIMDQISEGKIPESITSETYSRALNQLVASYKEVQEYAGQLLTPEEMPADGSPVEAYKNALINSEAMKFQVELKEYSDRLKAFLSVTSSNQSFADVLVPYQREADSLIEDIESGAVSGVENRDRILQALEGPEAFMNALTYPDFETEESMAALEKVYEKFPSMKIQMGISTGKYYVNIPAVEEKPVEDEFVEEMVIPELLEPVEEEIVEEEPVSEEELVEEEPVSEEEIVEEEPVPEEELVEEEPVPLEEPVEEIPEIMEEKPDMEDKSVPGGELPVEEKKAAIRFCTECGSKLEPGYKFCIECGSKVLDFEDFDLLSAKKSEYNPEPADDEYVEDTPIEEAPIEADSDDKIADEAEDPMMEYSSEISGNTGKTSDFIQMNEFIIDEKVSPVRFENSYKIYDMEGNIVGAAQQDGISAGAKASRILFGSKGTTQLQKFDLVLLNEAGRIIGEIYRDGGVLADICVDDADSLRILTSKLRFGSLKDDTGKVICKFGVGGLTKRTLKDENGNLLAEIDHRWNGMKSLFSTADKYYVKISPDLTGELRQIIVSMAIAYDLLTGDHR